MEQQCKPTDLAGLSKEDELFSNDEYLIPVIENDPMLREYVSIWVFVVFPNLGLLAQSLLRTIRGQTTRSRPLKCNQRSWQVHHLSLPALSALLHRSQSRTFEPRSQ